MSSSAPVAMVTFGAAKLTPSDRKGFTSRAWGGERGEPQHAERFQRKRKKYRFYEQKNQHIRM